MNKKKLSILFVFYLFTVIIFGGCGGSSDEDADLIQTGKYYVTYGENFDYPGWDIFDVDSYIRIYSFKRVGNNSYELTMSGILYWQDSIGITDYTNISSSKYKNLHMTRISDNQYETVPGFSPYVGLIIYDEENIGLITNEFDVDLEYVY